MSGLSWSEHVRLEAAAEWAATQEAEWRLQMRRDRRRRALRWLSWRQVVCDPAVAVTAPEGTPHLPSGAVTGTSGAAPTALSRGRHNPMSAPGVPHGKGAGTIRPVPALSRPERPQQ